MRLRLQPYALRLQPYAPEAATLCARGKEAATLRCTQALLAEHKPAWDDAIRSVVDVAFDVDSTLPEVSSETLTLTIITLT